MKADFAFIDGVRLSTFLQRRDGEFKVGEVIRYGADSIEDSLRNFSGKYVLIGVEEDIGPRANGGRAGAMGAFKAFLSRFLNMQANRFMDTDNLMILGRAKFECVETGFVKLREKVEQIDAFMVDILAQVYAHGKVPIVIGGGHNNAFPLIKAYAQVNNQSLHVINLDPHADFRALEGRHSGNSFSYAHAAGYLSSYTIHGLHKQYNSDEMLTRMDEAGVHFTAMEDYLDGRKNLLQDARDYAEKTKSFGVELDLDALANMPSSAMSPFGWSVMEARQWLRILHQQNPVYVNLTEGAPELDVQGQNTVGRTLAYFVADLIERK
jgi:formiminoglutamase